MGTKIPQRQHALDEGVSVKTVQRRLDDDPGYGGGVEVINGRYYFDADRRAAYDRKRAATALVTRPRKRAGRQAATANTPA
jgi:hypothetical protein